MCGVLLTTVTSIGISALWGCAKHDVADRLQSIPGDRRRRRHAALDDHYFGYCPVERVRAQGSERSIS
jgi:hypothetical protein